MNRRVIYSILIFLSAWALGAAWYFRDDVEKMAFAIVVLGGPALVLLVILLLRKGQPLARLRLHKKIYFQGNSADIKAESIETLQKLANYLKKKPGIQLLISGHTDLYGKADYNKDLSLKRAEAVRDFFVEEGLDFDRFQVEGHGYDFPLVRQTGPGYDEKNRRTEFHILD